MWGVGRRDRRGERVGWHNGDRSGRDGLMACEPETTGRSRAAQAFAMRSGAAGQRTSWSRRLYPAAVGGRPLGELPWRAVSVRISTIDSIALLEMAHGKANAFDIVFIKALREALGQAAQSDARAVVITA